MNELVDLSDKGVAVPEVQAFDAIIAENRSGLAPVPVILPEFDRNLSFGPAPWNPVAGPTGIYYPKKGDRAVVLRPTPDSIWIVVWTPKASSPDVLYPDNG